MTVVHKLEGFGSDERLAYERDLTNAEVAACKAYADGDDPEMIYCYPLSLFSTELASKLIISAPVGLSYFVAACAEPALIDASRMRQVLKEADP